MGDENDETKEILPVSTREETVLDIASAVSSIVPWVGGPVSNVLSGMSVSRKIDRVREVLITMSEEIREFKSEVSENYVRSDEFEELLEKTLRQVADERSDEKRHVYAAFLAGDIKSPGSPYDDKIRILRTLEEVQPDHIRMLKAMVQEPDPDPGMIGSVNRTLSKRLKGMSEERIRELAQQLTDMRLANLNNLGVTMTGEGAEQLQNMITTYGQIFLRYIMSGD